MPNLQGLHQAQLLQTARQWADNNLITYVSLEVYPDEPTELVLVAWDDSGCYTWGWDVAIADGKLVKLSQATRIFTA